MPVSPADARRLAAALPDVVDASSDRALNFQIDGKGFAWSWNERVHPKKPRVPRLDILAVRCPKDEKGPLQFANPEAFVQDPHYADYGAVVVRLDAIDEADLAELLAQGRESLLAAKRRPGGARTRRSPATR
ncbi:hypothetical protein QO010_003812 [Caulobacter ginsengisoli]|uniref:MmcQ/YjbR family DNA-binding protein n=1 Tax=Caulobacter ginsengisoli TaxID=400775 RepID=A0ABU0IY84_9CAUL|nr:MmcQ/YjbR family DNA-binding protein [Caulobacter ginsengisoli]MDQ0466019.1 hypothetical protein [Caulobacter ginsengisoli]